MNLKPGDVYRIVLSHPERRQHFHPKHLEDVSCFYEGLRGIRSALHLFDK